MKGITPVIAIIVLLLITVALAGAAWSYLSIYWTGLTAKAIEVTDSFCVSNQYAVVHIRNIGLLGIKRGMIRVFDRDTGEPPPTGDFINMSTEEPILDDAIIWPNRVVKYQAFCGLGNACYYRFTAGGRTMPAAVQC